MSHGVLAKLVTKLLDEKSQFPCSLGLLLQELITEAGNVLLDLFQLTFNADTPRQRRKINTSLHKYKCKQKTVLSHKQSCDCHKIITVVIKIFLWG